MLKTSDLAEFACWLEAIAAKRPVDDVLFFNSPYLVPEVRIATAGIRLYFNSRAYPPGIPDNRGRMGKCWVDLHGSPTELLVAATDLHAMLVRWPPRTL